MIDWERIEELRDEIGDEDFAEVAEMFLEEVEAVIERLRAGPPPESLEEELHSLKGSALNLGFRQLSRLCEQGERDAAAGNFDSISIPEVIESYERCLEEFTRKVPRAEIGETGELELL